MTYALVARFEYLAKSAEEREAYYAGIPNPLIRDGRRHAIERGMEAPEVPDAVSQLIALQKRAERSLGSSDCLVGDELSLADISLIPFVHRMEALGLLASIEALPHFHRWWKAMQARPSFQGAIGGRQPPQMTDTLRSAAAGHTLTLEALKATAL